MPELGAMEGEKEPGLAVPTVVLSTSKHVIIRILNDTCTILLRVKYPVVKTLISI